MFKIPMLQEVNIGYIIRMPHRLTMPGLAFLRGAQVGREYFTGYGSSPDYMS